MKEVGGVFMKDGQLWEILKYDYIEDSYVCNNLSSLELEIDKFREEEMGDKKDEKLRIKIQ
ncbi:hypothetical protein [Clostridium beijerinckii]|uniref:hypothetical protein n=1 Tax=Clostridium beijerinckii TaxID=1520 RepID=UPI00047A286A|nr:hypothetical protein [Clostridium beijerinckii]